MVIVYIKMFILDLFPLFLQLNKLKMYSFINPSSLTSPQADHSNPQSSLSPKQRLGSQKNQNQAEYSSDIQTPNFNDLHNTLGNQNIFDSYHHNFSQKNNQLSKLISTFEDLGLDIEYLQESDAQSQSKDDFQRQDLRKSSYNFDEELNFAVSAQNIPTVIYSKLSHRQKQHLENMKVNLKNIRLTLTGFLQSLNSFQKQCRSIFASSQNYFIKCLEKFYKKNHQLVEQNQKQRQETKFNENKKNYNIDKILFEKEEKIRNLIKDKEYLANQNSKLHFEIQSISSKYKKVRDLDEQNQEILASLSNYQIKNRQLQLYIIQQTQKIDNLEWKLKQSQKLYKITNSQNKNARPQLQRKYQNMFREAIQEMRHKIEAETYQKLKYDYPFHSDYFQEGRIIDTTSRYYDAGQEIIDVKLNLVKQTQSFEERKIQSPLLKPITSQKHLKLSLPSNMNINSRRNLQSVHLQRNQYQSSIGSNRIEQQQRRAQKIIEDIRRMKSSRVSVPSLSSSVKHLPYYARRNDYRI